MRNVSVVLIVVFLAGCVTESTGGLPPAAEDGVRLKAQLDLARGYFASEDFIPDREMFSSFPLAVAEWRCLGAEEMGQDVLDKLGVTDYLFCNCIQFSRSHTRAN